MVSSIPIVALGFMLLSSWCGMQLLKPISRIISILFVCLIVIIVFIVFLGSLSPFIYWLDYNLFIFRPCVRDYGC